MLSAYVLILTEVGKVAHVAQALGDLDGVQLAEDLAGPYDVIARIQAPGLDQLGRLVASRIQVVDGVTRTLTCMVIRMIGHRGPSSNCRAAVAVPAPRMPKIQRPGQVSAARRLAWLQWRTTGDRCDVGER
jgi:DNA-binding Lrp family transcriptional regulator